MEYSNKIQPICLPLTTSRTSRKYDDLAVILTGWGIYDNSRQGSQFLREAAQTVYSQRYKFAFFAAWEWLLILCRSTSLKEGLDQQL